MRIAYVLLDPGIGIFGTKGASVHAQEVIRSFRALGHEVTVFCTRTDDAVPADLADLDVVRLELPAGLERGSREIALLRVSDLLADLVAGEHAGIDVVYERYSLFSTAGARISERLGVPLLLEVNAPLIDEQRTHRGLVHDDHAVRATAVSFGQAARLVCVSEAVAEWVHRDYPGLDDVAVVPNGVNTDRIVPGTRGPGDQAPDAPVHIGFVGTLKPWHGTDRLLRAAAGLRGAFHLDIVGDGPEAEALVRLADDLDLGERVTFHGAVAPADVPAHLRGFDIASAPYPGGPNYFSPLKVYEYMAAGLPTVASAVGALPDLITGTGTGLLVPPDDLAALTEALQSLIDDPALRTRMGEAARAGALARHSWTSRCRDILDPVLLETA
ncbi:glycosyltransferase family 4 protein [Brevibacterium casei]|uniref:Glycosyltransferase involved in cell wall bisynthesis n=1 Tax=Brevibacterium casei CIP 102111 TaxID=1255625 RepID=A0A2H1HS58_9MICO|nr:glycosyltransferase family 4 protein [Brevibacterium casei]MCT1550950.1 glycosyltransferase family 4 protein [Brevibacterium casei]MCT1560270.1 glycosyltransferase family 4 protein [Brevibacterium casei]MCT2206688.1 glycosyltransferase family 4 protein [Brevibacterium casei]QPR38429.1 glycosyltransferase family 4 protein [Brevibacterium casei]QPR42595.1 glycosyltransferase family 4 protein [Brevibacterium casei]